MRGRSHIAVAVATAAAALTLVGGCAGPDDPLFPGLTPAAVDSIRLSTETGGVSITRADGWTVAIEHGVGRADTSEVHRLIRTVAGTTRGDRIRNGHNELATLGLEPEPSRIEFARDGELVAGILVGNAAPGGSRLFIQPYGRRDVYLSPPNLDELLRRPRDEWRDPFVMRFDLPDVVGVELTNLGERMVLKPRDGRWHMTQPIDQEVDKRQVDAMLYMLAELRAEGFVNDAPPESCGFSGPDATVRGSATVRLREGPDQVVLFGEPRGEQWCAMRRGRPDVYLVAREVVELLFIPTPAPSESR